MTIGVGSSAVAAQSGTTTISANSISSNSGSSFYIAVIQNGSGSNNALTITDNKGNNGNFVQIGTHLNDGSNRGMDRYYVNNGAGGAGHIFTATAAISIAMSIYVLEILGAATPSFYDQSNTNSGFISSATYPSGNVSLTPPTGGELCVTVCSSDIFSATIPWSCTGYTIQQELIDNTSVQAAGAIATNVVSTTGSYNAVWSDGSGFKSVIVALDTFFGTSVAPSPTPIKMYTANGSYQAHLFVEGGTDGRMKLYTPNTTVQILNMVESTGIIKFYPANGTFTCNTFIEQ